MSIGSTEVDFKEIYDAINGAGAHTTQEIGMESFYNQSFSDGGSTPASGTIGIGGHPEGTNDMRGKTIQTALYEWSKLDGLISFPLSSNVKFSTEIGWAGPNTDVHPDGWPTTDASPWAVQIQKIKDWLEEQNVIKGYTYYICFSFNNSYWTAPQVFNRTNGPNGEISAVQTNTGPHPHWDLYYISNVFEFPNGGIGTPMKGKNIEDRRIEYSLTIPTPNTEPNVSMVSRTTKNVIWNSPYFTGTFDGSSETDKGGYPQYSTLKGNYVNASPHINGGGQILYFELPSGPENGKYDTYYGTSSMYYQDIGFYRTGNFLRPRASYGIENAGGTLGNPFKSGSTAAIFAGPATWITHNGSTKSFCTTFLEEDERPSLILDCGEEKLVGGFVFGGIRNTSNQIQGIRHFTMKYSHDGINWQEITPKSNNLIDTDSVSAYNDWNSSVSNDLKYNIKTTEYDRMFQFNPVGGVQDTVGSVINYPQISGWWCVTENMLFINPIHARYFKFTVFSWCWHPRIFADLIFSVPP